MFANLQDQLEISNNPLRQVNGRTAYINFKLNIQDFGVGIPADKLDHLFINFGNLAEHKKIN